jgi:hypothetical protein
MGRRTSGRVGSGLDLGSKVIGPKDCTKYSRRRSPRIGHANRQSTRGNSPGSRCLVSPVDRGRPKGSMAPLHRFPTHSESRNPHSCRGLARAKHRLPSSRFRQERVAQTRKHRRRSLGDRTLRPGSSVLCCSSRGDSCRSRRKNHRRLSRRCLRSGLHNHSTRWMQQTRRRHRRTRRRYKPIQMDS